MVHWLTSSVTSVVVKSNFKADRRVGSSSDTQSVHEMHLTSNVVRGCSGVRHNMKYNLMGIPSNQDIMDRTKARNSEMSKWKMAASWKRASSKGFRDVGVSATITAKWETGSSKPAEKNDRSTPGARRRRRAPGV